MFSSSRVIYPGRAIRAGSPVASSSTTVSTAALSPSTIYSSATVGGGGVSLVAFDVQVSNVRCRWDGTDPTSTVGHLFYVGEKVTWTVDQFDAARFIRDTSASVDAVIFASPFNV